MDYVIENMNSILGAILLACFSAWLAYRTYLKTRKISASDKFKSSLLTELQELFPEGIQSKSGREVKVILRSKHNQLQSIVFEYGEYLSNSEPLNKAWYEFSGVGELREVGEEAKYNHYSFTALTDGTPFSKDPKALFINNVNRLLVCAKQT
ncbi:MAG: hypothetical protein HRU23_02655 [Gammaproteobacteria bacterium]|nr:hypothetical protein [Gammaproteobacteria bacterium]